MSQLSLWSGIDTLAKSFENEPQTDGSPNCACGKATSECSTHPNTREKWIASMQVSLAKTLALLENVAGSKKVRGQDYSERSSELLASFDPDTCSLRMLQQSWISGYQTSYANLPKWGLMSNGAVYRHPMSGQITTGKDGGAWLKTERGWENVEFFKPTDYLPTIRASEYKDSGVVGSKSHRHMTKKNYLCALVKDAGHPTGLLNPTWCEWLMGFPQGFTESRLWETRKYPYKPQLHGSCSVENEEQ
jgi:hypothetical protein